jgi:hypothetical protein
MQKKVMKSSPQIPLDRAKHPIFSSFTIHGILVRLPEKQTLNKIPEPDVSVPYLLKLSEGYGLALLLRA